MEYIYRNTDNPVFSVIIPCRELDTDANFCLQKCIEQSEPLEVIIVPDAIVPGFPATKRNWAMQKAKGKYFAFIDADAWPSDDWLYRANTYLRDYPAVCGPGVLQKGYSVKAQATDLVLRLLPYSYRVAPKSARFVPEFPTFNLIVRREYATKFEEYLTGEDSLFCRKINSGIFYHPTILVYHRRRELFKPFWEQTATYGQHRGYLIRLALLGWVSGLFVYAMNFLRGFVKGTK